MLWSDRHGPAGNVKAAAVLIEQEAECADIAATATAPQLAAARPAGAVSSELHFWVRYSLHEYISFMWQHAGYLIHRRRIRWPASLYMRIKSTATAALHFVLLRRGKRTYEILVDEHGIVRTSDSGVTLIGWADVSALRSYPGGLMLVLKRGTLPVPFRCLKEGEVEALRELVTANKGEVTQ
jgi:hypothetical protein